MKEIECNKHAWGQISKDHYHAFKKKLEEGTHGFNKYIKKELIDLPGKKIIHLQCNTGADTLLLAKTAQSVVGVDLVPDNICYARQLAKDLCFNNVSFFESDIMELMDKHNEKYDIVFVSEGAIGWLPDLKKWGQTIRHLLKDDGYFYVFDSHPFFMMFDEKKWQTIKPKLCTHTFPKFPMSTTASAATHLSASPEFKPIFGCIQFPI